MSQIQTSIWSETAASNNAATPNGWPENQNPDTVNDCAREDRSAHKINFNHVHGLDSSGALLSSAGTSTAYTVTYSTAPASFYTGFLFGFKVHTTCGADPTINVNGLGAVNIQKVVVAGLANLVAGDLLGNSFALLRYDATLGKAILLTPIPVMAGTLKLLQSTVAGNVATVDLETGVGSAYDDYVVIVKGMRLNTDDDTFHARLKVAGAYVSTATYWHHTDISASGSPSYVGVAASAATSIQISGLVDNVSSASCLNFTLRLYNANSTSRNKMIDWTGGCANASGSSPFIKASGTGFHSGIGAIQGIQFLPGTGTISEGEFRLYGVVK